MIEDSSVLGHVADIRSFIPGAMRRLESGEREGQSSHTSAAGHPAQTGARCVGLHIGGPLADVLNEFYCTARGTRERDWGLDAELPRAPIVPVEPREGPRHVAGASAFPTAWSAPLSSA